MSNFKLAPIAIAVTVAAASFSAQAKEFKDGDIHADDNSWFQFNLMHAQGELPGGSNHNYGEMEFGGRSGIFDLYGYVDTFDLKNSPDSDKDGQDKMFMQFNPRVSLDALTGKDLSFGPVQELFWANRYEVGGGANQYSPKLQEEISANVSGVTSTNSYKTGLGSNIKLPWLGTMGLNLFATYDLNLKDWNGYQISANWFKPVHFFANGSFLSYQGYFDYQFGMKTDKTHATGMEDGAVIYSPYATSSTGGAIFNGLYWHSKQFAAGIGFKSYKNVYGIKDSDAFASSGNSWYYDVTYKF